MTAKALKSPAQGHIPALDGIRGLAIFMVLAVHFFLGFKPENTLEYLIQRVSGYGTLGIDLFFLLSGFLITGILIDTRQDPRFFKNFIIRRMLRIFPLYYLVLALLYISLSLIPNSHETYAKIWEAQPWTWSYLFNFFIAREGAWTVPFIGHFWSLAVEEQFYLVWPLVVFALSNPRLIRLSGWIILLSTACHVTLEVLDFSKVSIHVLTPCRLNALCIGAWLATWLRDPKTFENGLEPIRRRMGMLLSGSLLVKILIVILGHFLPGTSTASEAFRSLSWLGIFAALHLAAVVFPPSTWLIRALNWRPLSFLGQYSYGIYIFHHFISWPGEHYQIIARLTETLGNHTAALLLYAAVGMGFSTLIAWISFHIFEKHFLRLKDILAPKSKAN